MAQFLVKVADDRGHLAQQVEHGYSESEVRERFVQQGYLVYWVKPRGLFSGGKLQLGGRKVKQSQFVIFNQQFLTLIKAGLPILNSLDLLIKRQKDANLKSLLQNVRERVKSGELLSDSFAAQGVFPRIYTTTLMAGEKSGNMEEVLGRYIAFQRLALTFKKKLAVSLVYPALLVTMVLVMLVFLVTYVVPEFAKLFENLNAQLPAITVLMLAVGTRAQKYAPFLAIAMVVVVALFWRWKSTDRGAEQMDADHFEDAPAGRHLVEVSGGEFLAHAFDSAGRRSAAGAVARNCGGFDEQPAHSERHRGSCGPGARGPDALRQPGAAEDVSRSFGGDDRSRRIHRSFAGHAEFGG